MIVLRPFGESQRDTVTLIMLRPFGQGQRGTVTLIVLRPFGQGQRDTVTLIVLEPFGQGQRGTVRIGAGKSPMSRPIPQPIPHGMAPKPIEDLSRKLRRVVARRSLSKSVPTNPATNDDHHRGATSSQHNGPNATSTNGTRQRQHNTATEQSEPTCNEDPIDPAARFLIHRTAFSGTLPELPSGWPEPVQDSPLAPDFSRGLSSAPAMVRKCGESGAGGLLEHFQRPFETFSDHPRSTRKFAAGAKVKSWSATLGRSLGSGFRPTLGIGLGDGLSAAAAGADSSSCRLAAELVAHKAKC